MPEGSFWRSIMQRDLGKKKKKNVVHLFADSTGLEQFPLFNNLSFIHAEYRYLFVMNVK